MSRIVRALLPTTFVIVLFGIGTSSAFATENPFYKLEGKRLAKGETREAGLKQEGNLILRSPNVGITMTCTGVTTKAGITTINGSEPGEAGTSTDQIEYSGCSVAGNGKGCILTSIAGAKDKKIVPLAMRVELELATPEPKKGVKILFLFTAAKGTVFVELKFEAEAGGECKFKSTAVEGSVDAEILSSKKETVAFEEREAEEPFGYIKALPNGTEACKSGGGCTKASLKAFGAAGTLEGIGEIFLSGKDTGAKSGVFSK